MESFVVRLISYFALVIVKLFNIAKIRVWRGSKMPPPMYDLTISPTCSAGYKLRRFIGEEWA